MAKREPIVKVDWTGKLQVYSFSDYLPMRALAHRVKDGDKEGIDKAAKIMAGLVMTVPDYKDGILVPILVGMARQDIRRRWQTRSPVY